MRDLTKVVIGFGSIYGLMAFGMTMLTAFSIGANDTKPEIIAIALYGFTLLPSTLLGIWYRRLAGVWLFTLSLITIVGLGYQFVVEGRRIGGGGASIGSWVGMILFATIPGLLGCFLCKNEG